MYSINFESFLRLEDYQEMRAIEAVHKNLFEEKYPDIKDMVPLSEFQGDGENILWSSSSTETSSTPLTEEDWKSVNIIRKMEYDEMYPDPSNFVPISEFNGDDEKELRRDGLPEEWYPVERMFPQQAMEDAQRRYIDHQRANLQNAYAPPFKYRRHSPCPICLLNDITSHVHNCGYKYHDDTDAMLLESRHLPTHLSRRP